jgi:hypothetical protein
MTLDHAGLLQGNQETPLKIFEPVLICLKNIAALPFLLEPIYQEAGTLDEEQLDRLRFALLRVQVYADIHRNEDVEQAQNLKYVALVLEKVIFGTLMLEKEETQG